MRKRKIALGKLAIGMLPWTWRSSVVMAGPVAQDDSGTAVEEFQSALGLPALEDLVGGFELPTVEQLDKLFGGKRPDPLAFAFVIPADKAPFIRHGRTCNSQKAARKAGQRCPHS